MKYYIIDAFTDKAFAGNPAAVCLLQEPLADEVMASIAREMNLSETAFALLEGNAWRLRWFTPAVEVRLCGHGTLATARALREAGIVKGTEVYFRSLSGDLAARYHGDWIELDFPSLPPPPSSPPWGWPHLPGGPVSMLTTTGYSISVRPPLSAQYSLTTKPR